MNINIAPAAGIIFIAKADIHPVQNSALSAASSYSPFMDVHFAPVKLCVKTNQ